MLVYIIVSIAIGVAILYGYLKTRAKKPSPKPTTIKSTEIKKFKLIPKRRNIKISPKHFPPRTAYERRMWNNRKNPDEE